MTFTVIPFDGDISARASEERAGEEIYASVPALNELASACAAVGNKLSQEGRRALFFGHASQDPHLRRVAVELGVEYRLKMETAVPDVEYMSGMQAQSARSFETAEPDLWMKPTKD